MSIEKFVNQCPASNKVKLRFVDTAEHKPWYGIQPDIHIFPLYCNCCHKQQSDFYLHKGSRYGFVGTVQCEFCEADIVVTDHDNIVDSIIFNEAEISFHDLYLLKWTYINSIEIKHNVSIKSLLMNLNKGHISINSLRELIEHAIGIPTLGTMKFSTDNRFHQLPDDINRWIELLHKADIGISHRQI